MKVGWKKMLLLLVICLRAVSVGWPTEVKADQLPPSEWSFTPKVLTNDITDRTTEVLVYVYEDTTLFVKNGSELLLEKFYKKEGVKTVRIEPQSGGTKLSFYLIAKTSGKKGKTVSRNVEKLPVLAPEQVDQAIAEPVIPKTISSKTKRIPVVGIKGTTLVIQNEKTTVKTVKFKQDGTKKISIPPQESGKLFFYLQKGSRRSELVSRAILDVTAPKAPKLKFDTNGILIGVKGELGTKVYIKGENGWTYSCVLTGKKWNYISIGRYGYCNYYKVYLKDAAGNKSKTARIKNPLSSEAPVPMT